MARSFKRHVGLNGVYNGDSEFMAGESIMFSGPADKIPAGYLIEDGSAVGRVAYATLFAAIGTTYGAGDGATTFNLPDSRGEFWRGLDLGRGVDVGRNLGVAQAAQIGAHGHEVLSGVIASNSDVGKLEGSRGFIGGYLSQGGYVANSVQGAAFVKQSGSGENVSRNLAKIPLIKY